MIAIVWALGASIGWGAADFFAGLQSRRSKVLVVVLISQGVGAAGLGVVVAARGIGPPGGTELVASLTVGVVGIAAVLLLYRALALGAMSVVAPITATSAAIPVIVGVVGGERPTTLQWVGMALAIAGCALASREGKAGEHAVHWRASILLAAGAVLAFGTQLVAIDVAAEYDPLWTILIARLVAVAVFAVAAAVTRPSFAGTDVRGLVAIGLVDIAANACFAIATTTGLLGVVAVLASTYPVWTVALAHRHLGERLGRAQLVGVVAALVGVVAITAQA